jgi:hypothetical protein
MLDDCDDDKVNSESSERSSLYFGFSFFYFKIINYKIFEDKIKIFKYLLPVYF